MNCHAPGCGVQWTWFRNRVLKRPGYYLQSQWFCSDACLERGVLQKLEAAGSVRERPRSASFQVKLEHILIGSGVVTPEQLVGRKPEVGLAQHLLDMGLVTERDITLALSRIHNIPVISLNNRSIHSGVLNTVPVEIVRTHDFFPLEFVSAEDRLVLVTCNPASVPTMVNLRGILGCQVAIYLSSESVVRNMIEQYCDLSAQSRRKAEGRRMGAADNPRDVACWIAHQAREIGAQSLQVARFGQFIWTRFIVGEEALNLVL